MEQYTRQPMQLDWGGIPCDFYLLPGGERVHPVSMWHRHKTRAKKVMEEIYPGIKHIKGEFKQNRFLYILDKKILKQYTNEQH